MTLLIPLVIVLLIVIIVTVVSEVHDRWFVKKNPDRRATITITTIDSGWSFRHTPSNPDKCSRACQERGRCPNESDLHHDWS